MKYMTVSQLKEQIHNLEITEPLIITSNGKPEYIITPYVEYKNYIANMLTMLDESHYNKETGNVKTKDELLKSLKGSHK